LPTSCSSRSPCRRGSPSAICCSPRPHQLPIANLAHRPHPTYNKYGIAQQNLLAETPLFPPALLAMTWREAELLVKTLAQVVIDRQG